MNRTPCPAATVAFSTPTGSLGAACAGAAATVSMANTTVDKILFFIQAIMPETDDNLEPKVVCSRKSLSG
ncbi:hypothetical protein GCM10020216_000410 [Nonomuraea helvata]